MEILFQIQNQWKVDIALGFALENEGVDDACHYLQNSAPWLSVAPAWRDFKGKSEETIVLYGPPAMDISRAMVIGLGNEKEMSAQTVRDSFATALKKCQAMGLEHIGIDLVSLARIAAKLDFSKENMAKELALAAHLCLYKYDILKQKSEKAEPQIRKISFLLDDNYCSDELLQSVRHGEAEAMGICIARNLSNCPSNLLTPEIFADEAQRICQEHNFKFHKLDENELKEEKMEALLAVGQGSKENSCCIIMEYCPNPKAENIALIGKGVTFDTGGISLKPSAGMHEMKHDMSGAAAVLGSMESLGHLAKLGIRPNYNIIAIIPLAENMPDGNAVKPGDVVYAKNGKSIEIKNTDAEGRLILADALVYAEEKYSPDYLLDIATLTGACAVALGNGAAGVFSTCDELAQKIVNFGNTHFERAWHLPLWEHFVKDMKSNVADLSNIGTAREGGALFAAMFLKQFVNKEKVWVHIDMAAADNGEDAVTPKGATGFGVRTLTDFALMNK